jgi:hypothetical protein
MSTMKAKSTAAAKRKRVAPGYKAAPDPSGRFWTQRMAPKGAALISLRVTLMPYSAGLSI